MPSSGVIAVRWRAWQAGGVRDSTRAAGSGQLQRGQRNADTSSMTLASSEVRSWVKSGGPGSWPQLTLASIHAHQPSNQPTNRNQPTSHILSARTTSLLRLLATSQNATYTHNHNHNPTNTHHHSLPWQLSSTLLTNLVKSPTFE